MAEGMTPLNPWVLAAFDRLPQGRGYRFTPTPRAPDDPHNPRDPHYDGVSEVVAVDGVVVARPAADGATYCCGVTFEAWWHALADAGGELPRDRHEVSRLVADWFCPTMGHSGVVDALVSRGLGRRIPLDEALPGDLVQYWRRTDLRNPSGHSAILLSWTAPVLRYASSQPATNGIGVHEETVGEDWAVHVVRPLLTGT